MSLILFNTLGRKKEIFKPINKKEVRMYTCGPTVYWYQTIGNIRSYIFADILKRVLLYNNFEVKQVINVTDVGHLTSDADEGEDKMEKAAAREGKKAQDIADYYFNIFKQDLKKLQVIEPWKWTKATEHIHEQINLIVMLEKKGFTYRTNDGIYFDTSKLKNYGKLALLKKDGLQAGKRIVVGDKRNVTDFALWKFSLNGKRQQEWKSPWGIGFPGWHIECSAMAVKYLGKQFDIHTGGEDHIPVHHTNEIAQSETAFEKKPWVKYWLHGAFLTFKGGKVSKSKGGLFTISELEEKEYSPLDYRYFCLTGHYRSQLEFSLDNLTHAKNSLQRLKNIISELKDDKKINKEYLKKFERAINDDLNIPLALEILWELLRDPNATGKIQTIKKMDEVLGLNLLKKEKMHLPDEVKKLIKERETARKVKDWKKADELRQKINQRGFVISDTNEGPKVSKL